jgi:Kef-type K+ transport system membrane component KefB
MNKIEVFLLLGFTLGAFVIPFLSRRLSIPSAVGEIFYGLFLGYFFKKNLQSTHIIEFLGELGFILLMYLAGLEINFEKIKIAPKRNLIIFVFMFIILVALSLLTSLLFRQPAIYVLVYSTTTIGLLFPVLKESEIMDGELGQNLLIIGSVGEAISLITLTLFVLMYKFGFSPNTLFHLFEIATFIICVIIFRRTLHLLVWWFPNFLKPFLKTGDPTESGVRANFVIIFVFVAFSSLIGLEMIVGAFLGGMLFALIFKEREKVQEKMSGFGYGFLIPIFFISVGLKFELEDFINIDVFFRALLITMIIFLIRIISSSILVLSTMKLSDVFSVPFATSFPLTLLIAIATFGFDIGVIGKIQASSILLAAILTALIFPLFFKKILRREHRLHSPNQ